METTSAIIPARSERQAMDWSLVLASQSIPTTIALSADDNRWALLVDPQDHERAVEAIRQYRAENRGWSWRRDLPWPGLTFHWGGALWCAFLALMHWLSAVIFPAGHAAGAMNNAAVFGGQWWRLFTAITLHADLGHLMMNIATGFLLLGFALARFGAGVGLLAAFLAGAGGNLAGLVFYHNPYQGVGASGMIMGALGMLAVESAALWRKGRRASQYILSGMLGAFMLVVLLGLNPAADVVAHMGGFLSGCAFGGVLAMLPEDLARRNVANAAALMILGALLGLTWWLGMSAG